jgi:hypothetical protein
LAGRNVAKQNKFHSIVWDSKQTKNAATSEVPRKGSHVHEPNGKSHLVRKRNGKE